MKKSNRTPPDKVILFQLGVILALIAFNWVMSLGYQSGIVFQPPVDPPYWDSAFQLPPDSDPLPKTTQEQPKIVEATLVPFDNSAVLKLIDDFLNVKDPVPQLKKSNFPGPIKINPSIKPAGPSHEIDTFPLILPEFPGGHDELTYFFLDHFRYPNVSEFRPTVISIVIQFVVQIDGKVTDYKVVSCNYPGFGVEREALRVFSQMPKWIPGNNGDEDVAVFVSMPLNIE